MCVTTIKEDNMTLEERVGGGTGRFGDKKKKEERNNAIFFKVS